MNTSWLTRPLFTFSPRVRRILWGCALLALGVFIVSPGLEMLAWHMGHGNTIEFRDKSVYVPFGWTADVSYGNHAWLMKYPFLISTKVGVNGRGFEFIDLEQSLSPSVRDTDDLYGRFESFFRKQSSIFG